MTAPRHTIEEWWAIYCLKFGIEQLSEPYCVGERDFTKEVADDLSIIREIVIVEFDKLRAKEILAGSNPH